MKTFYSILSLNIKPEINERLSVGMIMIFQEKVYFHYSKQKLSIIQNLIGKETYRSALDYLKMIENAVYSNKLQNQSSELLNLKVENKYDRIFSKQYLDYLGRYNNNLISFGSTNFLDLEATEQVFQTLFVKFIDKSAYDFIDDKKRVIDIFKKEYYPKVKTYFNIEKEIDSTDYSGLITPVKIDLMGKNEIEVFAQSIDFEKKIQSIEFNFGSLLQLNRAFPNSKQFILGYEPNKQIEINHRTWDNIRALSDFEYVDISEAEKIEEYAISHGVTPLFK